MLFCSFIIPAYNAHSTIVRCLDSIYALALNENDFEVICIDDCSTDNTIEVIEKYMQQHTNISLLRQAENHRQGAARNRGINIARGKYIVFVDSDDESEKGVIDALHLAEEHNLDMVAMHYVNIDEHGNVTSKESITLERVFTGIELQTIHSYWATAPWPYIYRTSFLQQVNYPFAEDILFEDSDFVNIHLYHARRMMYSTKCAYRVHYNATSTTHTTTYKHVADYLLLGTRMLRFYNSLENKTSTYALGIREGGSCNIWMSCKRLIKLSSIADVLAFYKRIDGYVDRTTLLSYQEPRYCWTWWTKLCLSHKYIAILLILIGQRLYELRKIM